MQKNLRISIYLTITPNKHTSKTRTKAWRHTLQQGIDFQGTHSNTDESTLKLKSDSMFWVHSSTLSSAIPRRHHAGVQAVHQTHPHLLPLSLASCHSRLPHEETRGDWRLSSSYSHRMPQLYFLQPPVSGYSRAPTRKAHKHERSRYVFIGRSLLEFII